MDIAVHYNFINIYEKQIFIIDLLIGVKPQIHRYLVAV